MIDKPVDGPPGYAVDLFYLRDGPACAEFTIYGLFFAGYHGAAFGNIGLLAAPLFSDFIFNISGNFRRYRWYTVFKSQNNTVDDIGHFGNSILGPISLATSSNVSVSR